MALADRPPHPLVMLERGERLAVSVERRALPRRDNGIPDLASLAERIDAAASDLRTEMRAYAERMDGAARRSDR